MNIIGSFHIFQLTSIVCQNIKQLKRALPNWWDISQGIKICLYSDRMI